MKFKFSWVYMLYLAILQIKEDMYKTVHSSTVCNSKTWNSCKFALRKWINCTFT